MRRIFIFLGVAIFFALTIFSVHAVTDDGAAVQEQQPGIQQEHHDGMMDGAAANGAARERQERLQRQHQMMRQAGVPEERINQWQAISQAQLYLDSPGVLLGKTQELELTQEQQQQLRQIQEQSREQARNVLTQQQRTRLGTVPQQPIVQMELNQEIHRRMRPAIQRQMREMREGRGDLQAICPMFTEEQNGQQQRDGSSNE